MADRRVILIGAGNIAHAHAQALRETPGVELFGVYDPNIASAKSLAKTYGVKQVFESMAQAATSGAQAAHIMTPPDAHLATGMPFVKAGMAVFMEKPLGCSMQECQEIQAAAAASGSVVGVNQNLVYNPAYRQLRDAVMSGSLGRLRHVEYHYAVPLKQLSAKLFGHWMFRKPVNILLEQAVHPLSQIIDLAGAARDIRARSAHRSLAWRGFARRFADHDAMRTRAGVPALSSRREFPGLPHDGCVRRRRGRGRHVRQPVPHRAAHRVSGSR
jgi:predicted dehydrogenase